MKPFVYALALTIIISLPAVAQNSAARPGGPQSTPPPGNTPQEAQSNAAGSTKDHIASGDQVTKPAGAKSSTLIGCLSGPDPDGKYTLRSMSHRTGVQVLGSDDLKTDSGSKVKLTGSWVPGDQTAQSTKGKESRKFQATEIEVLAEKCEAPSEKTPVGKQKQQKQQQKQKSSASENEDTTSPK